MSDVIEEVVIGEEVTHPDDNLVTGEEVIQEPQRKPRDRKPKLPQTLPGEEQLRSFSPSPIDMWEKTPTNDTVYSNDRSPSNSPATARSGTQSPFRRGLPGTQSQRSDEAANQVPRHNTLMHYNYGWTPRGARRIDTVDEATEQLLLRVLNHPSAGPELIKVSTEETQFYLRVRFPTLFRRLTGEKSKGTGSSRGSSKSSALGSKGGPSHLSKGSHGGLSSAPVSKGT